MIHKIFTVFDTKIETYCVPFYMPHRGAAIRTFTEMVNDPSHTFGKHPEDYVLFELGSYDDQTARVEQLKAPSSLGVGVEFVKIPNIS